MQEQPFVSTTLTADWGRCSRVAILICVNNKVCTRQSDVQALKRSLIVGLLPFYYV